MKIFDTNATGAVGFSVTARTAFMQEDEERRRDLLWYPGDPNPAASRAQPACQSSVRV